MDFSNMTNLRELFAAGGPVLVLLIILSVYSLSVILERFFKFRSSIGMSRKLIAYCRHPIRSDNYEKVVDACTKQLTKDTPASHVILALVEKRNRPKAELKEIADSAIDWEVTKLQRKLTVLGTLGSITPFIGLFGTVWGIMNAFTGLSSLENVSIAVVAPGIAEALVATAIGLFAAIPATAAYNYFANRIERISNRFESFSEEFLNILARQR